MARATAYDGVILDLRLPDMDGLTVLKSLTAAGDCAPVMMLTGFADVRTSVAALRLGALDVREKPLVGEDLVIAIGAVCGKTKARLGPKVDDVIADEASIQSAAHALAAPGLLPIEFLVLAKRFRSRVFGADARFPVRSQLETAADVVTRTRILQLGLEQLASCAVSGALLSACEFARVLRVSRNQVPELLADVVGLSFLQCRRALRIRGSLALLAYTREQSAQIAFIARYEHPAQCDRDFQMVTGLTPLAFRRACLPAPSG
jgi:CheY-like chemotaxis protein